MKKNLKVNKYHVTQDFCYSLYVVFYRILPHCRCFHEKHETPVFLLTVHYCAMIDKKRLYRFWKLHQSFFFIFFCLGHKCVRPQLNFLTLKSFYSHIKLFYDTGRWWNKGKHILMFKWNRILSFTCMQLIFVISICHLAVAVCFNKPWPIMRKKQLEVELELCINSLQIVKNDKNKQIN